MFFLVAQKSFDFSHVSQNYGDLIIAPGLFNIWQTLNLLAHRDTWEISLLFFVCAGTKCVLFVQSAKTLSTEMIPKFLIEKFVVASQCRKF